MYMLIPANQLRVVLIVSAVKRMVKQYAHVSQSILDHLLIVGQNV